MTESPDFLPPLDYDRIPIERHWELAMLWHDKLGHATPFEVCTAGCDDLASASIRVLFGLPLYRTECCGAPAHHEREFCRPGPNGLPECIA